MPNQIACLCIAVNLRIFHYLAEKKESSLSVEELADVLGIEEDFLRKLSCLQCLHLIEACNQLA